MCVQAGNYRVEGIQHVCFTADAQGVLTVSKNGVVSCWTWNHTSLGRSKASVAVEAYRSKMAALKAAKNTENAYISKMEPVCASSIGEEKQTWLQDAIQKVFCLVIAMFFFQGE